MRLKTLKLRNFRCYKDQIVIGFDDSHLIIGRNDAGKSAIMDALNIFFGEARLDKDDASVNGDKTAVEISCEFDNFPSTAVIDATYQITFEEAKLLNRSGCLEIVKIYDGSHASPKETGVYARAVHPTAEHYNDLLTLRRAELIARADSLGVDLSAINKTRNVAIRNAIWELAVDLQEQEILIPLDKEDAKKVWVVLQPQLPAFALFKSDRASTDQDPEAQDPLNIAIKEALDAKRQELEAIESHVRNEIQKIADATVEKIREMDESLASTLSPVITTRKWETLFKTSITGDNGIPLNKRGSGVRRLILLNFFRAKAETLARETGRGSVIYAVEEPETSQHPRNQRLLMTALRDLSSDNGRQVIITTHTPMLARALPDKSLRFIRHTDNGPEILIGGAGTNELISKSLGVLPDHSVKIFIAVEGKNDIAFLQGMAKVLRSGGNNVPNLEQHEIDGELIFVPLGGSNLALWSSRLKNLNRPEFHVCDRDTQPPDPPKYHRYIADVNARTGCKALCTHKREMENYIHHEAVIEAYAELGINITLSGPFADFDDVPMIVAEAAHNASTSPRPWSSLDDRQRDDKASKAKKILNNNAVPKMTVSRLSTTDPKNEIIGWLNDIQRMMQSVE